MLAADWPVGCARIWNGQDVAVGRHRRSSDVEQRRVRELVASYEIDRRVVTLDPGRGTGLAPVVPIDSIDPRGGPRVHRQGGETHVDRTKRGTSHLAPRSVDFLWAADPYFYSVCGRAGATGRTTGPRTEFSLYPVGDKLAICAAAGKGAAKLLVAGRAPDFPLANKAALGEKLSVTSSAAKGRSRVFDRLFELLLTSSAVMAKLRLKNLGPVHWRTHKS